MKLYKVDETVTVTFTHEAYTRVQLAVAAVPTEVAGWAEGEELTDGGIRLDRIAVPKHSSVSGGHAKVDEVETAQLVVAGEFRAERGICSWHSHANMGAFISGVDDPYFAKMAEGMPLFVGLVTNKKAEWVGNVYMQTSRGTLVSKAKIMYEEPEPSETDKAWMALVKGRVEAAKANIVQYSGGMLPGYMGEKKAANIRWVLDLEKVAGMESLGPVALRCEENAVPISFRRGADALACEVCNEMKSLRFSLYVFVRKYEHQIRGVLWICGSCAFGKREELVKAAGKELKSLVARRRTGGFGFTGDEGMFS